MRAPAAVLALLLLTGGCVDFGDQDAHVPGDELGQYHVAASLEASDCGENALSAPDEWEFDVRLSRDASDLFWLNGAEVIAGQIASDGTSFEFLAQVAVPIEAPQGNQPGCTVVREDHATGRLVGSGNEITGFSGTLRYGYQPDPESDCSPLVGAPGGFAALPCEMSYSMDATRTVAPDPEG